MEAAKTKSEKEKVKDVTVQNLINWGVVKNVDGTLVPRVYIPNQEEAGHKGLLFFRVKSATACSELLHFKD